MSVTSGDTPLTGAVASGMPTGARVDAAMGELAGATGSYERRLAELPGVYGEASAFAELVSLEPERLVYFVREHRREERPGDLIFGTSVVLPGQVGSEYHMSRGHMHRLGDRTEIYHCLSGHGVLLLQRDGRTEAMELTPGAIVYVGRDWIHRSINVGTEPLVTLFCYPADAGQDYGVIESAGGMRHRVVATADAGWSLEENPNYRGPRG